MHREISTCRVCGHTELRPILDLGVQALTGVFPRGAGETVEAGPLELVRCWSDTEKEVCGLVQLRHSYEPDQLYGMNYGYRSGLNKGMVAHLGTIAARVKSLVNYKAGDLALDIGSNDGTLLRALKHEGVTMLGMDPTAVKFRQYYDADARVIVDFFSAGRFRQEFGDRRAKSVTSIAMFYDLDAPLEFMRQIAEILDDDGVWCFEQSYVLSMLEGNSYDTVCHEHQEYYGLGPILWMMSQAGLKAIDIELNDANGGSFRVIAAKAGSAHPECTGTIDKMLAKEKATGLDKLDLWKDFGERVEANKNQLLGCLADLRAQGKKVLGYGASTKGNVILQYCGITEKELPCIAEVNPDKFGSVTPGTKIPIVSEAEAHAMRPDVFLVLPWHFRRGILEREADFLARGGKMLFPLPAVELT